MRKNPSILACFIAVCLLDHAGAFRLTQTGNSTLTAAAPLGLEQKIALKKYDKILDSIKIWCKMTGKVIGYAGEKYFGVDALKASTQWYLDQIGFSMFMITNTIAYGMSMADYPSKATAGQSIIWWSIWAAVNQIVRTVAYAFVGALKFREIGDANQDLNKYINQLCTVVENDALPECKAGGLKVATDYAKLFEELEKGKTGEDKSNFMAEIAEKVATILPDDVLQVAINRLPDEDVADMDKEIKKLSGTSAEKEARAIREAKYMEKAQKSVDWKDTVERLIKRREAARGRLYLTVSPFLGNLCSAATSLRSSFHGYCSPCLISADVTIDTCAKCHETCGKCSDLVCKTYGGEC